MTAQKGTYERRTKLEVDQLAESTIEQGGLTEKVLFLTAPLLNLARLGGIAFRPSIDNLNDRLKVSKPNCQRT